MKAHDYLVEADSVMHDRSKEYDKSTKDQGERSMARTVEAFNAVTGRGLVESEGWLLLMLLKQVRQWSSSEFHSDSALDAVAYQALLSEALHKESLVTHPEDSVKEVVGEDMNTRHIRSMEVRKLMAEASE